MRSQSIAAFVLCLVLLGCRIGSAAPAAETQQPQQVDEKLLRQMSREEHERRFTELDHTVSNLERKVTRLSDRIDRLEYDLKEVKRGIRKF